MSTIDLPQDPARDALLPPAPAVAPWSGAIPLNPPVVESRLKDWGFLLLALLITAGLGFFLLGFQGYSLGRPGIDENAYLVAGKNIAQHGTTGFKPADDFQFVGAMWLRTADGWYYPKYPFGLPLMYAVPVLLGHREWAFAISPLCMSGAALAMFLLARQLVGSFYAILAMLLLAMGPTSLQLAEIPNSHAPALCVVMWGMFFLVRWYRGGAWWDAVAAGLLLGFAVTIRYTEALLLFPLYSLKQILADTGAKSLGPLWTVLGLLPLGPLGIAVIARMQWRRPRTYVRTLLPILAWAVPVGALVGFNLLTIGKMTGYDATNESVGFSTTHFAEKWNFTIYQLYLFGLFLVLPLSLAGLLLMFRDAWRFALLLTLWAVPGVLLYTSYYWGAGMLGVGFLRFFLTLIPPLIIAALWLLRSTGRESMFSALAAGAVTAIAAGVGLSNSIDELERQHRGNLNLVYSADQIRVHLRRCKDRPVVFADQGLFPQLLQYMQYRFDADWYAGDAFEARAAGGFGLAGLGQTGKKDDDAPVVLQKERIEYIDAKRKGMTAADYARAQRETIAAALAQGRRVFAALLPAQQVVFRQSVEQGGFRVVEIDRWFEPCIVRFPQPGSRNQLSLPVWPDNVLLPWRPRGFKLYEVRNPPATQPAPP